MKVMPSVISDYESGRRKSPGIKVIKRIVENIILIDVANGGKTVSDFAVFPTKTILSEAVMDMKEFGTPSSVKDFCKIIGATIGVRDDLMENKLYGYTVVNSLKALTEIPPMELVKLHSYTNERAVVFANAHTGKSAMVAIRLLNLRPGVVILHGAEDIDELAKRIGHTEGIPIAIIKSKDIDSLISVLKKQY